ncbi:MAG: hypothetical protein AAB386_02585 [Patescibacteria group bacterium]
MGEPALKLEQIPDAEAEKAEKEKINFEGFNLELVTDKIGSEAESAERNIGDATEVVAGEVAGEKDLEAELKDSDETSKSGVSALKNKATAEAERIIGVPVQEIGEAVPATATETQPMEAAPVVEQTPVPVTSLEATELNNQIDQKKKALDELYSIPESDRTEKDDANIGVLSREIAILNNRALQVKKADEIKRSEGLMMKLDEEMAELLKGAPANDVEALPAEQKEKAVKLIEKRKELETSVEKSKVEMSELTAAALGIDRLLNQSREHLQSIEAADADAAKKEKLAEKAKEDVTVAKVEAEFASQKAEKSGGAAKAFVKGVGEGLSRTAGVGIGVPLFGFSKIMGWIDKGLKHVFSKDIVEKLKWALSVPEKILDWTLRKMGVEETDDKKQ